MPFEMKRYIIIIIIMLVNGVAVMAQSDVKTKNVEDHQVDMDSPTFVPLVRVGKVLEGKDSIQYMEMNNVYVYAPMIFKNEKQCEEGAAACKGGQQGCARDL